MSAPSDIKGEETKAHNCNSCQRQGQVNPILTSLNKWLSRRIIILGKRWLKEKGVGNEPIGVTGFLTMESLDLAEGSRSAIWVFDLDFFKVVWANEKALALWKADSKQELFQRPMSEGLTVSARNRLKQFQIDFLANKSCDEIWTIYPKGEPRRIESRFRGITLDDGRMAMLCEAETANNETCEAVRNSQALLYTSAMVSLFSETGKCLYANPAARQSHAFGFSTLEDRLCSSTLATRLLEFSDGVSEGKFTTNVHTFQGERIHEIDARISFDAATGQSALHLTEIDITERERAKQNLAIAAQHDALTGLLNRKGFLAEARNVISKTRNRNPCTLLFLDIDRFKNVNDTMGHRVGDAILVAAAQRLKATLPKECIIGRFGGDEFSILLPSHSTKKDHLNIGETILSAFSHSIHFDEHELRIDVSLGRSEYPKDGNTIGELLQSADLALYQAKENGGGQIGIFEPSLAARQKRFVEIENALRHALDNDGFELHCQPIVSLDTQQIAGAEALIRFKGNSEISCMPGEFIPVAESTGLINEIGIWVLKEAAQKSIALNQAGHKICLSANLSPQQFSDPKLIPCLREICQHPDFDPNGFKLEITESVLVLDNLKLRHTMEEITGMGIPFAIDDFGTAFSNLAALQRYPITCIKIDRSLTQADNFQALIRGIITIGVELGVNIVAEGVETEEQRDWLRKSGCKYYQGFLFSKPTTFAKLSQLLAEQAGTIVASTATKPTVGGIAESLQT